MFVSWGSIAAVAMWVHTTLRKLTSLSGGAAAVQQRLHSSHPKATKFTPLADTLLFQLLRRQVQRFTEPTIGGVKTRRGLHNYTLAHHR